MPGIPRTTLAVLLVIGIAGCGDAAPTAPPAAPDGAAPALHPAIGGGVDGQGAPGIPAAAAAGGLATFQGAPPVTPEVAQATIGPEGGSVSLGGFEVVVPPGAVDSNTLFRIRRPVDAASRRHVVVELGPHGRTFQAPVRVRVPLAGTTLESGAGAAVGSWDGEAWVPEPSRVIEDGARLETTVTHFSLWGLVDGAWRRGELSSGGR